MKNDAFSRLVNGTFLYFCTFSTKTHGATTFLCYQHGFIYDIYFFQIQRDVDTPKVTVTLKGRGY